MGFSFDPGERSKTKILKKSSQLFFFFLTFKDRSPYKK